MTNFQTSLEMSYANNKETKIKAESLSKKLKEHLKSIEQNKSLFFNVGETVYIPDLHGDFVHLTITLHRHGLIDEEFNLKKEYKYVFLGDFYDRAPDSALIDYWLNNQIKNKLEIYRLTGNHEMAFLEREENGHPIIFPSQDSIKDISNNFQITENILKNIAGGNILAAYVDRRDVACNVPTILYIHSYIINDDFKELGLEPNDNIFNFCLLLNQRFKNHGEKSYQIFLDGKQKGEHNWEAIIKPFKDDPLFNIYTKKKEIHTSFIWRRTGSPMLKTYPNELFVEIPEDVYQIVGHTPIFLFNNPQSQSTYEPFVMSSKTSSGKIQFSDVGIGYYYKSDSFERPEVCISLKSP